MVGELATEPILPPMMPERPSAVLAKSGLFSQIPGREVVLQMLGMCLEESGELRVRGGTEPELVESSLHLGGRTAEAQALKIQHTRESIILSAHGEEKLPVGRENAVLQVRLTSDGLMEETETDLKAWLGVSDDHKDDIKALSSAETASRRLEVFEADLLRLGSVERNKHRMQVQYAWRDEHGKIQREDLAEVRLLNRMNRTARLVVNKSGEELGGGEVDFEKINEALWALQDRKNSEK